MLPKHSVLGSHRNDKVRVVIAIIEHHLDGWGGQDQRALRNTAAAATVVVTAADTCSHGQDCITHAVVPAAKADWDILQALFTQP
jgi:hypothetical protein